MQTFLPYPDSDESAAVLDYRRCGKQRPEAKTILDILLDRPMPSRKPRTGWLTHPAVLMWKGYEEWLKLYYNFIVREWISRGYKNTMPFEEIDCNAIVIPHWLGDEAFHASHRSNLLRKDPVWYGQFGWSEPADLPYVWPVGKPDTSEEVGGKDGQ